MYVSACRRCWHQQITNKLIDQLRVLFWVVSEMLTVWAVMPLVMLSPDAPLVLERNVSFHLCGRDQSVAARIQV